MLLQQAKGDAFGDYLTCHDVPEELSPSVIHSASRPWRISPLVLNPLREIAAPPLSASSVIAARDCTLQASSLGFFAGLPSVGCGAGEDLFGFLVARGESRSTRSCRGVAGGDIGVDSRSVASALPVCHS